MLVSGKIHSFYSLMVHDAWLHKSNFWIHFDDKAFIDAAFSIAQSLSPLTTMSENADFTDAYIGDYDIRNLCKNPSLKVSYARSCHHVRGWWRRRIRRMFALDVIAFICLKDKKEELIICSYSSFPFPSCIPPLPL